jgi:hypothetical protein
VSLWSLAQGGRAAVKMSILTEEGVIYIQSHGRPQSCRHRGVRGSVKAARGRAVPLVCSPGEALNRHGFLKGWFRPAPQPSIATPSLHRGQGSGAPSRRLQYSKISRCITVAGGVIRGIHSPERLLSRRVDRRHWQGSRRGLPAAGPHPNATRSGWRSCVMLPSNQAAANGGLWRLWYSRSHCTGGLYPRAE